ncbi:hypothetical protein LGKMAHEF_02146 [Aeromonas salmonicida]|uniref:Uncharacterized protein n=1 Tax=Aeromonas salmonicida subsp. salmonicida 01-B526 TaxID=1076135 RepID=A0ABP2N518_AERSS|nr:hypothetical protein IYQ_03973 [Aeromonas salmonicida subsp. salmonicida 01-B526]MDR6993419.1 hypothetical protein [Aeromonas salmonicida]GAJ51151.1 hypothetical protein ASA01S_225_00010 [Aeromonas salmonicida subsp. masoucida NBRC 13784]SPT74198.1 Uncharacterised protein [Aeromonas salmonicida]SUU71432.1 Uncharacterised protein [Aeromonas salmonicida]
MDAGCLYLTFLHLLKEDLTDHELSKANLGHVLIPDTLEDLARWFRLDFLYEAGRFYA